MSRPTVLLTYAQSLDGCLARVPGQPLELSGPESRAMTHALRASHDAILVGIGTILADDPHLTVRHAAGPNPQPVVVDSRLRCPPAARVLHHPDRRPWLAACAPDPERRAALQAAGARVLECRADPRGQVDLEDLLEQLGELGVKSLMVEGGARIITAFLEQGLAQRLVLTLAPRLVGGVRAVNSLERLPGLSRVQYRQLGQDLIVEADLS